MKRMILILAVLVLLLAGCREIPDPTTMPESPTGPAVTIPEGTASSDLSDWTVPGDPPEADYQIPPQPTDEIITQ